MYIVAKTLNVWLVLAVVFRHFGESLAVDGVSTDSSCSRGLLKGLD